MIEVKLTRAEANAITKLAKSWRLKCLYNLADRIAAEDARTYVERRRQALTELKALIDKYPDVDKLKTLNAMVEELRHVSSWL